MSCTCTLVCTEKILANVRNGRKLEKGSINTSVEDDIISADICAIKGNVAVYKVLNIEKRHNYAS